MARIDTVLIRRPTGLVRDKEAPLDGLEISMSSSQTPEGKEQVIQEQKTGKDNGPYKTEETDSVKKRPAPIPLQTSEIVQNPAETMVQLRAAFSRMLETVINHTPGSELTNQEQPEPPSGSDSMFIAATATGIRPEQMTAAKAGDRRMPDYTELRAESSLHTMKSRAFLSDRETEASERDSELSQTDFTRVDKEMQPIILCEEHSGHQGAVNWQKPPLKGKALSGIQDRDGRALRVSVHAEYIHPINSQDMSGLAATRHVLETVTVKVVPEAFPASVGKTITAKLSGNNGMLTIELEPTAPREMTIKVMYEAGRATVSIMSVNPKALKFLSQSAGEVTNILEEKTEQQTMMHMLGTYQESEDYRGHQERGNQRQGGRKEKKRSQLDSFVQQLRLGLI